MTTIINTQTANHNLSDIVLEKKATNAYTNMLNRVKNAPAYSDVVICDEWLQYPKVFKEWFKSHYVEGWDLDKDFLGNSKLYSPDTCCFLPPSLNRRMVNKNTPKALISKTKTGKGDGFKVCGSNTKIHFTYYDYKKALIVASTVYSLEWINAIVSNAQEIQKCPWLTQEMNKLHDKHLEAVLNAKIEDF